MYIIAFASVDFKGLSTMKKSNERGEGIGSGRSFTCRIASHKYTDLSTKFGRLTENQFGVLLCADAGCTSAARSVGGSVISIAQMAAGRMYMEAR